MVTEDGNSPVGPVVAQHLGSQVILLRKKVVHLHFFSSFKLSNVKLKYALQYLVCELIQLLLQGVGGIECPEMEANSII